MGKVNNEISKLLEENRERFDGKPIAFDGVVDEENFNKCTIKTLFLLKEVNYPNMESDWVEFMESVRSQVSGESLYKTWPNVCLWLETLQNPEVSYSECTDEYGNFATPKLKYNLLKTAVVNIKKTAGGGSSKYDEILDATNRYGDVTVKEIEMYIKPDLVICGGTFYYAKIMHSVKEEEIKTLSSGARYFMRNNIMYLEFVHPMWFSVNRKILFAYAKTVFADVRELMLN